VKGRNASRHPSARLLVVFDIVGGCKLLPAVIYEIPSPSIDVDSVYFK
jgi:hypothetical protein